jgi:hypothetical protein
MTLAGVTFRGTAGPIDADRQYTLWLRATESLPLAWSSSLANARALAARAAAHPGSRIYAEKDAEMVGYIGTHPPFDWGDMGPTAPFGFPWTWPRNDELAIELYTRMLEAVPRAYSRDKPRTLIQRFRSTWSEHLAFVSARGWTERFRKGIWARRAGPDGLAESHRLRPIGLDSAAFSRLSMYADHDPALSSRPSATTLSERAASGWFSPERCWEAVGLGAFSLDVRGDWAEVQLFHSHEARVHELLALADVAAKAHGANALYFILGEGERRIEQLKAGGFALIDADIYMGLAI